MNPLDLILTRRSIRQFRGQPVPDETVAALLRAAMSAPSAVNEQPWQFVVIDDRATLQRLADADEKGEKFATAALAILVCGDTRLEQAPGNWMLDCAAATQNLLLAAHAHGLGAVWTGGYPNTDLVRRYRAMFGLPDEVIPLALVPIGYPAETKEIEDRYQESRIHRNRWQGED